MKDVRIERSWFQAKLSDKGPIIDAIVNDVKRFAQASRALVSLQISLHDTSSRSSNISKMKEWMRTFFNSLDNCSDDDEEKNC